MIPVDILPARKSRDSSRDARSRCRFAVHRPGIPEASPRSHGMSCRGFVLGAKGARLAVAGNWIVLRRTDIPEEVGRRFQSQAGTARSGRREFDDRFSRSC